MPRNFNLTDNNNEDKTMIKGKIHFEIKSDTGLESRHVWPESAAPKTQEAMREALRRFGEWIYDAGGAPVQWEYRNHWLPKLAAAQSFTMTVKP